MRCHPLSTVPSGTDWVVDPELDLRVTVAQARPTHRVPRVLFTHVPVRGSLKLTVVSVLCYLSQIPSCDGKHRRLLTKHPRKDSDSTVPMGWTLPKSLHSGHNGSFKASPQLQGPTLPSSFTQHRLSSLGPGRASSIIFSRNFSYCSLRFHEFPPRSHAISPGSG